MADWLGHLMIGWPTWLIGVAALAIFIAGIVFTWWTEAAGWGNTTMANTRKKQRKEYAKK